MTSCNDKKPQRPAGGGGRASGPIAVDGFVVSERSISENIEVPGSLLPFEETAIRSEVGGRIVQLNIVEGSVINKGTLLVKLFDEDLQAQLRKLEVQLKIKEKSEERSGELLKIQGISQQDYDLSALDVENLRADIESTKIAISKTEIRAPYTGRAGLRNVSLGAYIAPNDIITVIRQVDKLKLEFSIPEKYAKEISTGYTVSFQVDGGKSYHKAKVIATENSVDQNTRTLKVRALVDEKHPELIPGVFAKVNLELGKNTNALMVPTQSVIPTARNKQVIVIRGDSAVYAVVETGVRDSAFVHVTSGVKVGDTVVTTGLMAIRPDSKIKIARVTNKK
ncbi:efflux RND transporter periplasmic adaptor subunit [Chryseolinea sp. H1M3-3]|uniref:efflux RND transporter periplasmic adaptor subunit n=1 Tax=Chryseolinea sp. H1M3-3 TaxID=3034144 RepID=UPI0023EC3D80|nr:efflux RND transporter periplasmic adaptor subunit [Chryseolinea sp. H1M3-3]